MKKRIVFSFLIFGILVYGCAVGNTQTATVQDSEEISIGYIGCSNTRETVEGYHHLGGQKMWGYERRYGSGTILDWSRNPEESVYWEVFDRLLEKHPGTKAIWWQLCIMDENRETSYEHANIVLDGIRKRIPGATIYVSALADYNEGVCSITGTWGLEKGKELARELELRNDDVLPGPVLGPMDPIDTAKDGCHLSSPDGKRKLGNQMRLFFDHEDYSPNDASIGYLGCSNTMQTAASYWFAGGRTLWGFDEGELHEYDGGAVLDWSRGAENGNDLWKAFDRYLESNPNTKAVWWQLCIRKEEPTPYEDATPVLEAIRQRIPEAVIYVSPLAEYTDGICEITGTVGIERAKALAQELDSKNEDVILGPILGPMTPQETYEDGCHLSEYGMRTLGQQMRLFFDNVSLSGPELQSVGEAIADEAEENLPENAEEELSPEDEIWRGRIEKAMAPSECPEVSSPEYPGSYYRGPLIDTHLHIPAIPDWSPEDEETANEEAPEGRFGGPQALLGWNVKMSEIACTLKNEGTMKNFAFFPVYEGEISLYLLEIWNKAMDEYPEQFTPFIMASGNDGEPDGFPTVDAETLQTMLEAYPGLFEGYGEIGLYERENGGSPELPPDSKRLLDIYPIVRENSLVVYFHLGEGHKDNFEKVLNQNPDINFIWHGDQLSVDEIEDILDRHPNAYYGVDAFWGHDRELFLLFVGESKEEYLERLDANFNTVLNYAVSDWKPAVERHPDQFVWGIDRGDAVWNYDLEVGQMQVKLARAFIGKLDPEVQEKIAYRNAERLLADGASAEGQ